MDGRSCLGLVYNFVCIQYGWTLQIVEAAVHADAVVRDVVRVVVVVGAADNSIKIKGYINFYGLFITSVFQKKLPYFYFPDFLQKQISGIAER